VVDKKSARRRCAHLVLIDESGFLMSPLVRRTLAPRGRPPVLKTKGARREKVSISENSSILWIMATCESFFDFGCATVCCCA
jgi:hypothetical protein